MLDRLVGKVDISFDQLCTKNTPQASNLARGQVQSMHVRSSRNIICVPVVNVRAGVSVYFGDESPAGRALKALYDSVTDLDRVGRDKV